MFSNGSEYESFLVTNCEDCPHYVHYNEATKENPACEIENDIALSSMSDVAFPYKHLIENGTMAKYDCKKRLGVE